MYFAIGNILTTFILAKKLRNKNRSSDIVIVVVDQATWECVYDFTC